MFNIFSWIRRRVAEEVVKGAAEGMRALVPEDGDEGDADTTATLRKLLASHLRELPAAESEDEEKAKKSRK